MSAHVACTAIRSKAFGKNHLFAITAHLGAIEEGHAEQNKWQPLFLHHGFDLVEFDVANLYGIERDPVTGTTPFAVLV